MIEKSFVTVEQKSCVVCGKSFDTGAVLLDRRMTNKFERETVTGYGLCQPHQKLHDTGYVAFVSVDPDRCASSDHAIQPQDAYRTGDIAHLKRSVAKQITGISAEQMKFPVMFIDDVLMLELKTFVANNGDSDDSPIN